ncbi:aminotransferase [Rhizobium altiplani]|uniref:Aminotransferase n=1 Tax=Rhizobium altiplani TaxID=1864509 RepID=A0A120FIT4_9HYPH|nr:MULTISPECIES: cysteine desulfurase-like protein [Rhizobium]KWV40926.1 aminotransferase [Rhizobium altiplani]KWV48019.1 aminotransferase [Rhizobium altiplani]KWV48048.1 aminotransferase [Rhizobium altiplani]KWV54581.1 aminotransferase [Rhizobium altiplani]
MNYDVESVRRNFPGLQRKKHDRQAVFLDNPAGTQVAASVIERMTDMMINANGNLGGFFDTSLEAASRVEAAHRAAEAFVNAYEEGEVFFGQSATALTFAMSRSIGSLLSAGDEIILSRMDHDANVAPWLMLAEDLNLSVKWLDFSTETYEFDPDDLVKLISDKTRLVAVGYASNITGTINNVQALAQIAHRADALVYVDAVQYAPHGLIDVQRLGCDFLVCSAYKFFGPHYALLWGRRSVLDRVRPYKVRAASDTLPWRFTNGTTNREQLAGVHAAIDYIAALGDQFAGTTSASGLRARLDGGYKAMKHHDDLLALKLIDGLRAHNRVRVLGISDARSLDRRVSTVTFVAEGVPSADIARHLASKGIHVWSGHNYGLEANLRLGILDSGGGVRIGPVHYNTLEEIDRTLTEISGILSR